MPIRLPVQGKTKLWLTIVTINSKGKEVHQLYDLRLLVAAHPEVADPAWRLTKTDGQSYSVALTEHGPVCDCPDYTYCRQNQEKLCKHVEALRARGLLSIRVVQG